MENNDMAYDQMEKAQSSNVFGNLFCIIGTGLIAYPVVTSLFDETPRWSMAWSGCALILITIPIFHNYNKQSEEAIRIYNSDLGNIPGNKPTSSVNFGVTPNGLGFKIIF